MNKSRCQKTINRKLQDLDDHLYLLKESLAKLAGGDAAYIKPLATELRVLVCKASRTEGLLWRILDELKIHDLVHIHLPGKVDRNNPLSQNLQFLYAPICRAGHGDPRLIPNHYSLKEIIKECEALMVGGVGYTHEKLIRAVAEQMGSAHEDEGVEPHLIELIVTISSHQSVLNSVLMIDTDLVLEVGEKALEEINFVRRTRPTIVIPNERTNSTECMQDTDFENSPPALTREGWVMYHLNQKDSDWKTNSNNYDFGLLTQGSLSLRIIKHCDRTMEISIEGVGESIVTTRQAIPYTEQPSAGIVLTWDETKIVFYLCGEKIDTKIYAIKD